jgi:hypothetical protein
MPVAMDIGSEDDQDTASFLMLNHTDHGSTSPIVLETNSDYDNELDRMLEESHAQMQHNAINDAAIDDGQAHHAQQLQQQKQDPPHHHGNSYVCYGWDREFPSPKTMAFFRVSHYFDINS